MKPPSNAVRAIRLILDKGPQTTREVGDALGVKQSSIWSVLYTLELKGILARIITGKGNANRQATWKIESMELALKRLAPPAPKPAPVKKPKTMSQEERDAGEREMRLMRRINLPRSYLG
jgi:biotin operon repressor